MSVSMRSTYRMKEHVSCFRANPMNLDLGNCSQCRWRKVRCDRQCSNGGGCGSCERLGLRCSFAQLPQPLSDSPLRKPRRLRGPRACIACREKKIRCSATVPQCLSCKRKGLACSYPSPKRPIRDQSQPPDQEQNPDQHHRVNQDGPEAQPLDHEVNDIPSTSPVIAGSVRALSSTPLHLEATTLQGSTPVITDTMLVLIDAFFETMYPLPSYAFLHPQTTKDRCRDSQMHRVLSSAICAVAALHIHNDRTLANNWIQDSEQSLWVHLESPTIPRLQTLLLIIHCLMEMGRFERAFMLTATAARFAAAMRLNYERPDLDPIAREIRRRIVWSLKIVERYFCLGLPEFEVCPMDAIYINFPISDEEFGSERPGEDGAYSIHVRLESVRRDIMKLTRGLSPLEQPLPFLTKLMGHHENSLSEIESSMPDGSQLSTDQTMRLIQNPWLPRRMLMHLSWHLAHCDLYRILLPGYPEAAPSVVIQAVDTASLASAEQQCLRHATSIIHILIILNQESSVRHLLEFDTAICAYHAARLLLFISRFGKSSERPTPEFAASRVDLCLAALKRFFPSSPLVKPIIEELQYSIGIFLQQYQQEGFAVARLSPPYRKKRKDSSTTQATQRLAVHSLLRQAEFSDEDEEKLLRLENKDTKGPNDSGSAAADGLPDTALPQASFASGGLSDGSNLGFEFEHAHTSVLNVGAGWGMGSPASIGSGFEGHGGSYPLFAWSGGQGWDWLFDNGVSP